MWNPFVADHPKSRKEIKPTVACYKCIYAKEVDNLYIECQKYRMLSLKDKTCKSGRKEVQKDE